MSRANWLLVVVSCLFLMMFAIASAPKAAEPKNFLSLIHGFSAIREGTLVYELCVADENHFCSTTSTERRLVFSTKTRAHKPAREGKVTYFGADNWVRHPKDIVTDYGAHITTSNWAIEGPITGEYRWSISDDGTIWLESTPEWRYSEGGACDQDDFTQYKGKYLKGRAGGKNVYFAPVIQR